MTFISYPDPPIAIVIALIIENNAARLHATGPIVKFDRLPSTNDDI